MALAFVLGVIGFQNYHPPGGEHHSLLNSMYHSAQMCILHTPHLSAHVPLTLGVGRWLAALTLLLAIITFLRAIFREESTVSRRYRLCGHEVLCGFGGEGMALVESAVADASWSMRRG
jgi:hypothetical protein